MPRPACPALHQQPLAAQARPADVRAGRRLSRPWVRCAARPGGSVAPATLARGGRRHATRRAGTALPDATEPAAPATPAARRSSKLEAEAPGQPPRHQLLASPHGAAPGTHRDPAAFVSDAIAKEGERTQKGWRGTRPASGGAGGGPILAVSRQSGIRPRDDPSGSAPHPQQAKSTLGGVLGRAGRGPWGLRKRTCWHTTLRSRWPGARRLPRGSPLARTAARAAPHARCLRWRAVVPRLALHRTRRA